MTDPRPLGPVVADWSPAEDPVGLTLTGRFAALTPLDAAADAPGLWAAFAGHDWVWDYLGAEPPDAAAFAAMMQAGQALTAQPCYVIRRARGNTTPLGYACFWTVVRDVGVIEIGNVNLSPALQGTPVATEAFYLMIKWAFDHGYRRVEWKCNALNAPSRRAAQRLGFSFEGIFRQHQIALGRNRDTAWFAMIDTDWARLQPAFDAWLSQANFDDAGRQRQSLSSMTAPFLVQADPSF